MSNHKAIPKRKIKIVKIKVCNKVLYIHNNYLSMKVLTWIIVIFKIKAKIINNKNLITHKKKTNIKIKLIKIVMMDTFLFQEIKKN